MSRFGSCVLCFLFVVYWDSAIDAATSQDSCYSSKAKRVFVGLDVSNSISSSDILNYKPFLKAMDDDILLDTNVDNEMLVYVYATPAYSGYFDSTVWTSGDSSHLASYKTAIDNYVFNQASSTISQQVWRSADLAFEEKFTRPSEAYEEIVVIVGDGMPHKQYNFEIDSQNTWIWDGSTILNRQKGNVYRNGAHLFTLDFQNLNCENFFGTVFSGGTGRALYLPEDMCGSAVWNGNGANCGSDCGTYRVSGTNFEIFVGSDDCPSRFSSADRNRCKDYCEQDCLIEAFEATYFRDKYASSTLTLESENLNYVALHAIRFM